MAAKATVTPSCSLSSQLQGSCILHLIIPGGNASWTENSTKLCFQHHSQYSWEENLTFGNFINTELTDSFGLYFEIVCLSLCLTVLSESPRFHLYTWWKWGQGPQSWESSGAEYPSSATCPDGAAAFTLDATSQCFQDLLLMFLTFCKGYSEISIKTKWERCLRKNTALALRAPLQSTLN